MAGARHHPSTGVYAVLSILWPFHGPYSQTGIMWFQHAQCPTELCVKALERYDSAVYQFSRVMQECGETILHDPTEWSMS